MPKIVCQFCGAEVERSGLKQHEKTNTHRTIGNRRAARRRGLEALNWDGTQALLAIGYPVEKIADHYKAPVYGQRGGERHSYYAPRRVALAINRLISNTGRRNFDGGHRLLDPEAGEDPGAWLERILTLLVARQKGTIGPEDTAWLERAWPRHVEEGLASRGMSLAALGIDPALLSPGK